MLVLENLWITGIKHKFFGYSECYLVMVYRCGWQMENICRSFRRAGIIRHMGKFVAF